MMDEFELLSMIEGDCSRAVEPILDRIVYSAKRTLNSVLKDIVVIDDLPDSFSPFDCIAYLFHEDRLDSYNPFLIDHIEDVLVGEYESLKPLERIAVDYCDCATSLNDLNLHPMKRIYARFWEEVDRHSESKRLMKWYP